MDSEEQVASDSDEVVRFVTRLTDSALLRIEEKLPHGFVRLKVAEAERRQAQHDIRSVEDIVTELLRNARDAGARNILVGFQKERGKYRRLTVIDDGCGVPPEMHELIFEPRVTSKREDFEEDRFGVHGRGMALFSIRSRAGDARVVTSVPGKGTVITLTADTQKIPERSDQTTLPKVQMVEGMPVVGPGPHNVLRVLLEMSVDCPGIRFYIGSFAEVLSTLRRLEHSCESVGTEAVWSEVVVSTDASALANRASNELGLPVSRRNAYRVLNGEVRPLKPVAIEPGRPAGEVSGSSVRERPAVPLDQVISAGLRNPLRVLGREAVDEIGEKTRVAVDRVLDGYFLKTSGPPKVRKGRGRLTVSFYVCEEDEESY